MVELALFPLHHVLFPGRPLQLHIFELRYRQLLADCLAGDQRFGVVGIRSGSEVGPGAQIFQMGTVAQIESVTSLPDGRSDVVVRGTQRFRIVQSRNGTPYLRAEVELIEDPAPDAGVEQQAAALRSLLTPYLAALGAPDELLRRLPTDPDELAYLAAATLHGELGEEQRLLEMDSAGTRLELTAQLLRREMRLTRRLGAVGSLRPPGPCGSDLN